jgi:hypothetical protein
MVEASTSESTCVAGGDLLFKVQDAPFEKEALNFYED